MCSCVFIFLIVRKTLLKTHSAAPGGEILEVVEKAVDHAVFTNELDNIGNSRLAHGCMPFFGLSRPQRGNAVSRRRGG
jgi:aconitase A